MLTEQAPSGLGLHSGMDRWSAAYRSAAARSAKRVYTAGSLGHKVRRGSGGTYRSSQVTGLGSSQAGAHNTRLQATWPSRSLRSALGQAPEAPRWAAWANTQPE